MNIRRRNASFFMGYTQDLVNQGYGGYAGWGDTEAYYDFRATGGSGKKTSPSLTSGGGADYSALLSQQKAEQAAQSTKYAGVLESQIPGIQQRTAESSAMLQQKETNLKDRYSTLINQIKGKEATETKTLQTNLGVEYGKRGIPLSSGAFQQDVAGKTSDIGRYWTDKLMEAQTGQESDVLGIQQLALQLKQSEADSINQIKTAIATQDWQGAQNAIQTALQLQQFNEGIRQFNESQKLKEQELSMAQTPSSSYTTLGEGSTLFNLLTGQPVYTATKTYKPTGGDEDDPLGLF